MTRPKYNESDLLSLKKKFDESLSNRRYSWYESQETLLTKDYDEKDFVMIIDHIDDKQSLCKHYSFRWYSDELICSLLIEYPDYLEEVLSKCNDIYFADKILKSGVIPMNKVGMLSKSSSKEIRKRVAEVCDLKTLRGLTKDKSIQVRKTAYLRLGPIECLDDMLSDRSAKIRYQGVMYAPMNYPKLSEMTNEIARDVFIELIKKIDKGSLPMLLSNRNLKDKYASSVFQRRLASKL